MGSGIALTALTAGYKVVLQDVSVEVLGRARAYLENFLAKKEMPERIDGVRLTESLEDCASADLVIEAALEQLELKRSIFSRLDGICSPQTIFASNTSTLSITAIAAAVRDRGRVVGMHFFNPAPVLPLVEVIGTAHSRPEVVSIACDVARKLGKTPVVAGDRPGFIVNRVARPFYGEALRLLGEGIAGYAEIDTIVEQGGGFKMGPFRLMDLIGIDINAAAMRSMYEQTFGEPRYRPHWIQAQKLESGELGRKTGRGFYEYVEGALAPKSIEVPERESRSGSVVFVGGSFGPGLEGLLESGGYQLLKDAAGQTDVIASLNTLGRKEGLQEAIRRMSAALPAGTPLLVQCADAGLDEIASWIDRPENLIGFDGLFLGEGSVATLTASERTPLEIKRSAEKFLNGLGRLPVWVKDGPGLVLPRIVAMLVNEAAFAVLEGVADGETIDLAMRLGVSYPLGPLEWGRRIGWRRVLAVLDHLQAEYGEERYRACRLLRGWAREEQQG